MKNSMVFKIIFSIFMALILIANISFASYDNVTMTVEAEPVCKIDITDRSYFEKKLVEKDLSKKNVTIQLSVVNNELAEQPTGELFLLIDNSLSMTKEISSGVTRSEVVRSSAKKLIENLLDGNDNLKIGIVSFSTSPDVSQEGTSADAKLISELSNDVDALQSSIDDITDDGPRTDLDSGLALATKNFKSDSERYIVVLTDGVPNVALEDNDYYADTVIEKTKQTLTSTEEQGINLITMLTGIDTPDEEPIEDLGKTYAEVIEEIFGTAEKPTAGAFYYIQDDEIEKTITETIYDKLKPIAKTLKDISVVDVFPKEIVDNFDFSYVSQPSHGTISKEIEKNKNNSITWNIPELDSGETATVKYKLSLKRNYDSKIVGKLLDTNTEESVAYTDFDGKKQEKSSEITPQLKLAEPLPTLPKAGSTFVIATIALVGGVAVFSLIKYLKFKNI